MLGASGILAELVVSGHTESPAQWIPVGLAAVAIVAYFANAAGLAGRQAMQVLMIAIFLSGLVGVALHMKGKMEFKKESDPSLQGWSLMVASLESKTPPPLAPGAMAELGLLGFVWIYAQTHQVQTHKEKEQ